MSIDPDPVSSIYIVMRVKLHEKTRVIRDVHPKRGQGVDNLPDILLLPVLQCPFWSASEWDALLNMER